MDDPPSTSGAPGPGPVPGLAPASAPATAPDPERRAALLAMPKAELHLHLDGSVRIATALDLARTRDVDAPLDEAGMRAALVAPMPCRSQAELLGAFEIPIRLLQ